MMIAVNLFVRHKRAWVNSLKLFESDRQTDSFLWWLLYQINPFFRFHNMEKEYENEMALDIGAFQLMYSFYG